MLNRLFRPTLKGTSKTIGPLWGIHRSMVDGRHKRPAMRKTFPCHKTYDETILLVQQFTYSIYNQECFTCLSTYQTKTILFSRARQFTLSSYFIASLSKMARYEVSFVNVQSVPHAVPLPFRCSMWYDGIIGRVIWSPELITHSDIVYFLLPMGSYYITSTHTYNNVSLRDILPSLTTDIRCNRGTR